MKIAIHPDDYTSAGQPAESDASSPKWAAALEAVGHEVRWVDVRKADILEQIKGCDGFMWRWAHFAGMSRVARRLLPVIENELGLATYPDQKTCWHYDDKIAQAYLLEAASLPIPKTWVFFDREAASEWTAGATYPLVIKLSSGAGSTNVQLVGNAAAAAEWIDRMFSRWQTSLEDAPAPIGKRAASAASVLATGLAPSDLREDHEPQRGYVLFQEFLPDNDFDTRITVIGNRAFGFRRMNRKDDFRASGSGELSYERQAIDEDAIRLAFKTSQVLGTQSVAIDGLKRGDEWVLGEVSYTYMSSAVRECPGHWELEGEDDTGALLWVEGAMWPEEAQIADFIARLEARSG